MKKVLLILAGMICLVSTGLAHSRKNNFFSETGTVRSFGNMPFNFPGFVTENGKQYLIEADDAMKKELLDAQGKKIILNGTIAEKENNGFPMSTLKDGTIKADSFKIIEQE